jgi:hypothetical protein
MCEPVLAERAAPAARRWVRHLTQHNRTKTIMRLGAVIIAVGASSADVMSARVPALTTGIDGVFAIRGISYPSFHNGKYASAESSESLAELAKTGANYVAIVVTRFSKTLTDATFSVTEGTEADANVAKAVADAHGLGLSVLLKPHVDSADGKPRARYAPADIDAWFRNYEEFLLHYATFAAQNHIEMLAIGCELDSLTGSRYRPRWLRIIRSVRSAYRGPILYASGELPGTEEVSFWDAVDYIGVDAYNPLSSAQDPSVAELVEGWRTVSSNSWAASMSRHQSPLKYYRSLFERYRKPVIFSEIGYMSVVGAMARPGDWRLDGPVDLDLQARAYEAFFEVWSRESSWMKGAFLWNWEPVRHPERTPRGLKGYSPQNKPALNVISRWYRNLDSGSEEVGTSIGRMANTDGRP